MKLTVAFHIFLVCLWEGIVSESLFWFYSIVGIGHYSSWIPFFMEPIVKKESFTLHNWSRWALQPYLWYPPNFTYYTRTAARLFCSLLLFFCSLLFLLFLLFPYFPLFTSRLQIRNGGRTIVYNLKKKLSMYCWKTTSKCIQNRKAFLSQKYNFTSLLWSLLWPRMKTVSH